VGVEPDVRIPVQRDHFVAKPIDGRLLAATDAMLTMAVKIVRGTNQTLQAARKQTETIVAFVENCTMRGWQLQLHCRPPFMRRTVSRATHPDLL